MKITRKQLRKLIAEHMTKPNIPNIPSGDAYVKIEDLARDEDSRASADSLAGTFGYPEDRSYSDDLHTYDESGRLGGDIHEMRELGHSYAASESHGEPEEYYIRRDALENAAKICDSYKMSMVKPLIDAFTEAANDYEKTRQRIKGQPVDFEYEAYDIAGRISLRSDKLDFGLNSELYSDLYDGTINETTIKPNIPNVPSDDAYTKIDDLARSEEMRSSADSLAGAYGYPEDLSYSDDLRTYDDANMPTMETVSVYRHPNLEIAIPRELVDNVIDAHLAFKKTGGFPGSSIFRQAAIRVFHYVEDETKRIAGEDKNVYEYGLAVRGYRADEYEAAMMAVGEHL
jgi:hypothetical protein